MLKKESRQVEMFALVEELPQSKMTREEFCKIKGLSKNCFYYWQKKYRQQHQESHAGFISVRTGTGSRTGFAQPVILTYPNGISLQLPAGVPGSHSTVIHWPELVMMIQGISLRHIHTRKRYLLTESC